MTIPVVTFVGRSGSGKTTLLVRLIAELRARGYRLATIKHHSHPGIDIDRRGKDSWRHAQAGSSHVLLVSPARLASYRLLESEPSLGEVAASISGVDLILVEGYKRAEAPTVEVVRSAVSLDLVGRPEWRIAVASDTPLDVAVPRFDLDDVAGIADLIESRFLRAAGAARSDGQAGAISWREALRRTLQAVEPLGTEVVDLLGAVGRVAAEDLTARVDAPSVDASLKDGYAVRSADAAGAGPDFPVHLSLAGVTAAGQEGPRTLPAGAAVRVLTGAPVPGGADAVVSAEFASDDGSVVTLTAGAEPGRNILARGSDVTAGQPLARAGDVLRPALVGLLAAAGLARVPVHRRPRVAILATGDEVIAPGRPLRPGQLYASNLVTLAAWCARAGLAVATEVLPDSEEALRAGLLRHLGQTDAVLTSGGAWQSERDLVVRLLDDLGWLKQYHRVRMGPGKAVAFGLWQGRPVFCLPGGPPSNQMAFLQLALPGLHRLEGRRQPGLPVRLARLARPVSGQVDWTQFVHGRLEREGDGPAFYPLRRKSRLQEMAEAQAIVQIPEGVETLPEGTVVEAQVLGGPDLRGEIDIT